MSAWRGGRGEWYVVGQFVLLALVVWGLRALPGWPPPPEPLATIARALGALLALVGLLLGGAAVVRFGSRLTPLPYPIEGQELVVSGPYRLFRHPMYGAVLLLSFGWSLWVRGWLTVVYATALALLLVLKSRREERWLAARHRDYDAYRRRVRRFIPYIW